MAKKKSPASSRRAASRELREEVLNYISRQGSSTFNYKQVAFALGATGSSIHRAIALLLAELAFDGDLIEVSPGKYKSPQRNNVTTGVFVRRANGKNSVITDADGEAIMVAERNSMHALNGDKVRINIAARRRGVEPEAQVIEIIEEKDQTFIGTLQVDRHMAFLETDSKFLANDIMIQIGRAHV